MLGQERYIEYFSDMINSNEVMSEVMFVVVMILTDFFKAGDDQDIIDEALCFFKANVFFKSYEVKVWAIVFCIFHSRSHGYRVTGICR